jgi:hypothetical protein
VSSARPVVGSRRRRAGRDSRPGSFRNVRRVIAPSHIRILLAPGPQAPTSRLNAPPSPAEPTNASAPNQGRGSDDSPPPATAPLAQQPATADHPARRDRCVSVAPTPARPLPHEPALVSACEPPNDEPNNPFGDRAVARDLVLARSRATHAAVRPVLRERGTPGGAQCVPGSLDKSQACRACRRGARFAGRGRVRRRSRLGWSIAMRRHCPAARSAPNT